MCNPGFADCFTVVVDDDAQPVDVDEVLADFLVRFVEKQTADSRSSQTVAEPAAGRTTNGRSPL